MSRVPRRSLPRAPDPFLSRGVTALVALLLAVMAVQIAALDVLPFVRRTDGVLTEAQAVTEVRRRSRTERQAQVLRLRYEFKVAGQRWAGHEPYLRQDGWAEAPHDPALRRLRAGDRVTVWYDLRSPDTAWLAWQPGRLAAGLALMAAALLLAGLVLLRPSLWRDDRQRPRGPGRAPPVDD